MNKKEFLNLDVSHPKAGTMKISSSQNKRELNKITQAETGGVLTEEYYHLKKHTQAMNRLIWVVQELSLARTLEAIMEIVRHAARELTGADGATFVLRDGDKCYYAEEDAISPLWKGKRFPMSECISGWSMLNRQKVMIEDIYLDSRIPHDAYKPTFVKSLIMVPIRTKEPIGAIGNYWATRHQPTEEEVNLLQSLADTTSVAMENVQVYEELEQRVIERTKQLEFANKELESFSYSVSHDLRAPLRYINGFSKVLLEDYSDKLDEEGKGYLREVCKAGQEMNHLIDDILQLSRVTRSEILQKEVNLSEIAHLVVNKIRVQEPDRVVTINIEKGLTAQGDERLLHILLTNLLGNAWKFTATCEDAEISFGRIIRNEQTVYFVRDNGAGFDMDYAYKLFVAFQRLHHADEFEGAGIGLAIVQRVVNRHGGEVWAEAKVNNGATFYFTLS